MGTGASGRPAKNRAPVRQLPTLHPLIPQPMEQPQQHTSHHPPVQRPVIKQKPEKKEMEWPLPPNESEEAFDPKWPPSADRYSVKRSYQLKVSVSKKKYKATNVTPIENFPPQKETSSTQSKELYSSIHDSAHVQSSLRSQSHACVNLSTTNEIDRLFASLSEVQAEFDLHVEEQYVLISKVVKEIIELITSDARAIQQNLLGFGKEKQMKQDELYRQWLQLYIIELDKWKSTRLADLQNKMETHQKQIMAYSQQWIMRVNTDANTLKDSIMKAAQQEASSRMQQLIGQIQAMPIHHLGTETMTKINLIIHGNVGNKIPGQGCIFDFEQCDKPDERKAHGAAESRLTKKDLQKPNQRIIVKQANSKRRISEHQHEEQVVAYEQREKIDERQYINHGEDYEDEDEDEQ